MNENTDFEKTWKSVLSALKTDLSEASFNAYLKNTRLINIINSENRSVCEVGCMSTFVKNTIEQRFWTQISLELERVLGRKCEVVIKVENKSNTNSKESEEVGKLPLFEMEPKNTNRVQDFRKANLKEDFTFENYAVSGSNQMAYAAALAVAKKPGTTYNPLFIYGGVGVGKTHLMQAIGHEIINKGDGGVLFCSGEEFTNDLVEAIRFKSTEKVRNKYRKVKLLLIDDVQFIAGKPTVQEEFFHTFNAIQKDGGQVVMTSDKPPSEISKLEERLRSRFGAGLIVDVGPADFELRTAILLIKAKQRSFNLSMETAQMIAANVEGVRELQGVLIKVETEEKLLGKTLNKDDIQRILKIGGESNGTRTRVVTPNEIFNTVGGFYGVGITQLKGDRRTKMVAWPRQILMYLLREDLKLPLEEVGRLVGGRDHTTVMHATDKVRVELEENHKFQAEIGELRRKIFSGG